MFVQFIYRLILSLRNISTEKTLGLEIRKSVSYEVFKNSLLKFTRTNFQDSTDPLCFCSLEAESTSHFFLRCQNFTDLCKCLVNELI